jgi:hypothetical protein
MQDQEVPITLNTFGDLLRHGYKLCGHCRLCSVHKDIDLTALPPDRVYVGARFTCRDCSGRVEITLSQIETASDSILPAIDIWRKPK